jgi:hypothetical protein
MMSVLDPEPRDLVLDALEALLDSEDVMPCASADLADRQKSRTGNRGSRDSKGSLPE